MDYEITEKMRTKGTKIVEFTLQVLVDNYSTFGKIFRNVDSPAILVGKKNEFQFQTFKLTRQVEKFYYRFVHFFPSPSSNTFNIYIFDQSSQNNNFFFGRNFVVTVAFINKVFERLKKMENLDTSHRSSKYLYRNQLRQYI